MTLPVALSGTDVIGQAKTGTGKTLGFGLPLLERVTVPADVEAGRARPDQLTDAPQALIVVPTRELCTQVTNDLLTAGKVRNVRVLAIYGGRAYEPQVEALRKGVDVIVGTPGRLLDLAGQKKLDLSKVRSLVLDEADEMLDLGFLPDVEKIIQLLPARRQTMLFSATMPGAVIGLARRYMSQPTHIRATSPDDEGATVANITQRVYRAHSMDKPELVSRILQAEGRGLAMIFCRTKRTAADIADQLARRGFASGAVHGDLGQGAREQALRAFRNGKVDVLVCTDVAARGIDVEGVTHVINYQSPEEEKTYLHRIGRTGRAGASGTAVTLVDWDDIPRWQLINKALDLKFHEPAETYSTSPHLFEELNIPAGTKGVLPRAERTRAGLAAEELEDLGETGGRGRSKQQPAAPAERPARTRTPRQRRRTRGGSADAAVPSVAPAQGPAGGETAVDTAAETSAVRTPRRRRRTRAGAGASSEAPVAVATVVEPVAPSAVPQQAEAVTAESVVAETVAKPRRRRTRTARPVEAVETVTAVEPAAVAVVEEPKRTRTRTVRKTAAEAPAELVEATETVQVTAAVEVAEKPKRAPRARKTAATAPAVETPAAEVVAAELAQVTEKPKRKRTVKKVVAEAPAEVVAAAEAVVAAAAAEVAEVAEKPKRAPRARKTVATEAPAEVAAEVAEKPKRKRTVKKVVAAAPADAPAEAAQVGEKPKRTRTVKKTAEAAEAPAAEKPKRAPRARKAAVAQPES
ncbi:DEAD/DEAH box helicase [Streptomyces tsukubensis]